MITAEMQQMLDLYNEGLELYKTQKFQEAMDKFNKALEIKPDDGPAKLYLDRCEMFLENPPGEDWDGVFTMTSK